jgi:hypothetical protein
MSTEDDAQAIRSHVTLAANHAGMAEDAKKAGLDNVANAFEERAQQEASTARGEIHGNKSAAELAQQSIPAYSKQLFATIEQMGQAPNEDSYKQLAMGRNQLSQKDAADLAHDMAIRSGDAAGKAVEGRLPDENNMPIYRITSVERKTYDALDEAAFYAREARDANRGANSGIDVSNDPLMKEVIKFDKLRNTGNPFWKDGYELGSMNDQAGTVAKAYKQSGDKEPHVAAEQRQQAADRHQQGNRQAKEATTADGIEYKDSDYTDWDKDHKNSEVARLINDTQRWEAEHGGNSHAKEGQKGFIKVTETGPESGVWEMPDGTKMKYGVTESGVSYTTVSTPEAPTSTTERRELENMLRHGANSQRDEVTAANHSQAHTAHAHTGSAHGGKLSVADLVAQAELPDTLKNSPVKHVDGPDAPNGGAKPQGKEQRLRT